VSTTENCSVLIIGATPCAVHIARDLSTVGKDVTLASSDTLSDLRTVVDMLGANRVLPETDIVSIDGAVGNFSVRLDENGKDVHLNPGTIVLAEADVRIPNFQEYGLSPEPPVFSHEDIQAYLGGTPENGFSLEGVRHLVFLHGLISESHPLITAEIMSWCTVLQREHNVQTYVLTRNLKVAADGLEVLYRESKAAGTTYVKFAEAGPVIKYDGDGNVLIEFDDDVTGLPLTLTPDTVVVDQTIRPSERAIDAGRRLGIETDSNGFVQGDNVHRLTVRTNKKGIFVAGPARAISSVRHQRMDAANTAVSVNDIQSSVPISDDRAVIDRWQCVRCLTCYRVCLHGAIHVEGRVTVLPEACEGCGICTAECPRHAVTLSDLDPSRLSRPLPTNADLNGAQPEFTPMIAVFCCSRSGTGAADLARCMGYDLPERLTVLEIPCAGGLSYDHVFAAFQRGADGLLALTCHTDNCHSNTGNTYARHRLEQLSAVFRQMGFSTERLRWHSLASNMGAEFAEFVSEFESQLRRLGPSRVKVGS